MSRGRSETLAAVGEAAALRRILPRLQDSPSTIVGPGDDAAVLGAPDGRFVVTTDTMIEGPDFRRAWSRPFDLGWKAAATNLADVAAMGAVPTGLVVALAAPDRTPVADLEALADGLASACAALAPQAGVVGGDLASAPVLTIAVTAFGSLEGRRPVLRSGARTGDVLAVAGALGRASAALRLLFLEARDEAGREIAPDALQGRVGGLLDAQLAPRPPIAAGPAASDAGATAMLDVSDGLLLDARRIAEASGVLLDLDPALLAPDVDAVLRASGLPRAEALRCVYAGGEDHAMLATFPPSATLPSAFRPIGRVLPGGFGVRVGGEPPPVASTGWDPFAERP